MGREVKICSECKVSKDETAFSKRKHSRDGLKPSCKACDKIRYDEWAKNNPEKKKSIIDGWRERNPEKVQNYSAEYYQNNREHRIERVRLYREENPEKVAATAKAYAESHREELRQKRKERGPTKVELASREKYRRENVQKLRNNAKEYAKKNRPRRAAAENRRRAAKIQATPSWADLDAIRLKYEEAAIITLESGIQHHVDHTVPLKSKYVCGLHVEENLQVIPKISNIRKSNLFPSDGYREFFGPGGVYLGMDVCGKNNFADPESPAAKRWLGR